MEFEYRGVLQVLYETYCVPMEAYFQDKAFTAVDQKGFQWINFQEYSAAVFQMVQVYKIVEDEVSTAFFNSSIPLLLLHEPCVAAVRLFCLKFVCLSLIYSALYLLL